MSYDYGSYTPMSEDDNFWGNTGYNSGGVGLNPSTSNSSGFSPSTTYGNSTGFDTNQDYGFGSGIGSSILNDNLFGGSNDNTPWYNSNSSPATPFNSGGSVGGSYGLQMPQTNMLPQQLSMIDSQAPSTLGMSAWGVGGPGASNGQWDAPATSDPMQAPNSQMGGWRLPSLSPGQAEMGKMLTGLAGLFAQRQKAKALSSAARKADPYAAYRGPMAQRLEQSYSNPNAYRESPEAQARLNEYAKGYNRTLASKGKRGSPGLAMAMQAKEAEMMNQYRQGLAGPSGSNISPGYAANLNSSAADANLAAINSPFAALGNIYQGRTDSSNYDQLLAALAKGRG